MEKLFDQDFLKYVQQQRILLVGIGGIGCELLKVLIKYKFDSLHLLDLDTIEVSNLNRQFLFRKEHKGQFKSEVAKNEIQKQYPKLNVFSYTTSILDYGVQFFRQFTAIFLALDNIEARSHANRYSMILQIPIIEAGTTGFLGQAMLMKCGISRCYDCFPKEKNQKSFAVCTIRTLPEKPLHCIIWAKYFFGLFFSQQDDNNLLEDQKDQLSCIDEKNNIEDEIIRIFNIFFNKNIKDQIQSDPDKFENLKLLEIQEFRQQNEFHQTVEFKQNIHDLQLYIDMFTNTFKSLQQQKLQSGFLCFQKDDDIQMRFITSCSNIRSYIFGIEFQNEFQVKKVAGNIVPAIASTNSIVAALQGIQYLSKVSEYIKYLQQNFYQNTENSEKNIEKNKELYIQSTYQKIMAVNQIKSNTKCMVCQPNVIPCLIFLNFQEKKLYDFLNIIENKNFVIIQDGTIIYEQDPFIEDDELENQIKLQNKQISQFSNKNEINLTVLIDQENGDSIIQKYILVNQSIDDIIIENKFDNQSRVFTQKACQQDKKQEQPNKIIQIEDDECFMVQFQKRKADPLTDTLQKQIKL